MKLTGLSQRIAHLSVIEIVDHLLIEAARLTVSDIHLDPTEKSFLVRFRLDGLLEDKLALPKELSPPIISRLKVLAGLRTDEHQAAQDGRFSFHYSGERINVRLSLVPTYYGTNAVMRLLVRRQNTLKLEELGFSENQSGLIKSVIKRSSGMILVTGPTGSGKTTTLYNLLNLLQSGSSSLVTIEDPIEYAIPGISQIQVNHRSALNFTNGLRAILRQDPDIIMVGEIRDRETAAIATTSALTGHLLLSTLHTNDAVSALSRLRDLGIESYLISSTVSMIIGQRLARKICDSCKSERKIEEGERRAILEILPTDELKKMFIGRNLLFYGKGCKNCRGQGLLGRLALVEVLLIEEKFRTAIVENVSLNEFKKLISRSGFKSIKEDGFSKALEGVTTFNEVIRIIHE